MGAVFPTIEQDSTQLSRAAFNALSHDLNTPLACIIGSLETIMRFNGTLSAEHRDTLLATALAEAHKLDGAIADLMHQAKPE